MAKKRRSGTPRSIRMMNYAFIDEARQRWDFVRVLSKADTKAFLTSDEIERTLLNDVAFSTVREVDERTATDLLSSVRWGSAPTDLRACLFSRGSRKTLVLILED